MFPDLVPIGLATILLGTIHESDGVQERQFWLRNDGAEAVVLQQGYASCHCTTIDFERGATVAPGDSTCVILRFNPQGKGGEFYESGTVRYSPLPSSLSSVTSQVSVAFEGTCITSEETLLRQFPIQLNDHLSLSRDRFDFGVMAPGSQRTAYVTVLHWDEDCRRETLPVVFTAPLTSSLSPLTLKIPLTTSDSGKPFEFTVMIDVIVR